MHLQLKAGFSNLMINFVNSMFQMVMENLRGTPNLAIEVVEAIADKMNRKMEEKNPHNWRRMQEIEVPIKVTTVKYTHPG